MVVALAEAEQAAEHGDVPVGAVVAYEEVDGAVVMLASAHNRRVLDQDPTAHAEILALREASRIRGSWRLSDCVLVVTLEPCPMCAGAAVAARIGAIVFGASDPKAGACGTLYNLASDPRLNHNCDVLRGIAAPECSELLSTFFAQRRANH